jgi:hypothetical protein
MVTENPTSTLFHLINNIPKYFCCFFLAFYCFALNAQDLSVQKSDSLAIRKSLDEKIQFSFQKHRSKPVDFISDYLISPWGNGVYSLPALGGIYIYGNSNDDQQSKDAAIYGFETFLFTAVTTSIFKLCFHRHRPCETDPPNSGIWDGPSFIRKNVSFPSGHATSAFSIATLLASEYKGKPGVAAISFSLASLVAISRVYQNKHWLTDVLAGALVGFGCGKLIYYMNK